MGNDEASLAGVSAALPRFAGRLIVPATNRTEPRFTTASEQRPTAWSSPRVPPPARARPYMRLSWLHCRARGVEVTVVSSGAIPPRPLVADLATELAALHGINSVELNCDAAIGSYDSGEAVVSGHCGTAVYLRAVEDYETANLSLGRRIKYDVKAN